MSWGSHPDTLTLASARGFALATGHPEGSLEYLKAFRVGYEKAAGGSYPDSLARLLARMDAGIAERTNKGEV